MKINQRDQRVRITKQMIRAAFLRLLSQKPVHKITVRELCEAAAINRGTFYLHYLDIYDLMEQTENELLAEFSQAISVILAQPGRLTTNYDVCREIFSLLAQNSDFCTILLGDQRNKGVVDKFAEAGKRIYFAAYEKFFPDIPKTKLEAYYLFVSSGCISLFREWLNAGMAGGVDSVAEQASKIMTLGMGYLNSDK